MRTRELGSLTDRLHGRYERERTRFNVDLLPRFLALLLVQCEGILPLLRTRTLAYRAPVAWVRASTSQCATCVEGEVKEREEAVRVPQALIFAQHKPLRRPK